ncbi:MAG: sensor hybrid histidine kinase [Myxococcales bacterium]|nr:sensor hybrid histidine kinase [Myxococcales bacterium]
MAWPPGGDSAARAGPFGHVLQAGSINAPRTDAGDHLHAFASVVPVVMLTYRVDPDGNASFAYCNARIKELFDLEPAEVVQDGGLLFARVDPDDIADVSGALEQSALAMGPLSVTFRVRNPRRGTVWAKWRATPVREADGHLVWHGVMADVTEHPPVVDPIALNESQFRFIIEASPIAYALNDEQQNITYLNPEFVRTFGYTQRDIPTLADWWPRAYPDPSYRQSVIDEWGRRLTTSRASQTAFEPLEVTIRTKAGDQRIVIAYAVPLAEAFTGAHLVVLYDITKVREAEAGQRRLIEQLSHSQRVESLGRLAGGVAHDNNNMLAVILGKVELALRQVGKDDRLRSDLLDIRQAAEDVASLTRQLVAYARLETTAPSVISIESEVQAALAMLRRVIDKSARFTHSAGAGLWPICIDATQLRQVLTNLVLNATDALRGAGSIAVAIENVSQEAILSILPPDAAPTDYVCLSVTDDGCGMSEDVVARVFEPFFSTKPRGKATGLGLSTVYGIVRQNGGFVSVRSTVGEGSVFSIYLPRSAEPAAAPSATQ